MESNAQRDVEAGWGIIAFCSDWFQIAILALLICGFPLAFSRLALRDEHGHFSRHHPKWCRRCRYAHASRTRAATRDTVVIAYGWLSSHSKCATDTSLEPTPCHLRAQGHARPRALRPQHGPAAAATACPLLPSGVQSASSHADWSGPSRPVGPQRITASHSAALIHRCPSHNGCMLPDGGLSNIATSFAASALGCCFDGSGSAEAGATHRRSWWPGNMLGLSFASVATHVRSSSVSRTAISVQKRPPRCRSNRLKMTAGNAVAAPDSYSTSVAMMQSNAASGGSCSCCE